jgi:hypothetical protein
VPTGNSDNGARGSQRSVVRTARRCVGTVSAR